MRLFKTYAPAAAVFALLASPARDAFAWNFVGHETVARIAWDQLTPAARGQIIAIMRQHPALAADLLKDMPRDVGDRDMWAFVVSASWPDIIRDVHNPWHAKYHHAPWHYINMPYVVDGTDPKRLTGAATGPMDWHEGEDPADVVEALQKCEKDLRDPSLPAPEKAIALSWYLHLAGDLHQPLHANTLFSDRFPSGDRGGNNSVIRTPPLTTQPSLLSPDDLPPTGSGDLVRGGGTAATTPAEPSTQPTDRPMNLHAYWDNIFGTVNTPRVLDGLQREITDEYPPARLAALTSVVQYRTWAQESFDYAVRDARRNGTLDVAVQVGPDDHLAPQQVPPLPADYLARVQEVARLRMATAGYRIARVLNDVFAAR